MTVQATFAATLVDEWVRGGITDVVVCPGSRSTPIALAMADAAEAGSLRLHTFLDERSAAFFALGLGLVTGRPAVVLTTSGTAAAELLPAIIEAHHGRVPLIACTADRPPELHHVGAAQTIEQDNLFGGALRWRCDPGLPESLPTPVWRSLAARVIAEALDGPAGPGPVHCNVGFRDPLVGRAGPLPPGRSQRRPWHARRSGELSPAPSMVTHLAGLLASRRGAIVAGAGIADAKPVVELAKQLRWPVLADPRSGCRGSGHGAVVIAAFDGLLRPGPFADFARPAVVLRLGSPPSSKALATWLASSGAEQVACDPWGAWPDPERTAALIVAAAPSTLADALVDAGPVAAPEGWDAAWGLAESAAQGAIDRVLARHCEPSEPAVARVVTEVLGAQATLMVSSSMPIRDVEWFGHPRGAARVLANRGANGIDGVVSTALGVAAGADGPTAALIGDLAFLHDSGGLLWARRRGVQLTYVVVDNNGGGIFSFLPQAGVVSEARFDGLFGTPHGVDLSALAAVHGIPTTDVEAAADIGRAVQSNVAAGGVRVVRVQTDRRANVTVHEQLAAAIVEAAASAVASVSG